MKEIIKYYYNIIPYNSQKSDNALIFYYNNQIYVFCKVVNEKYLAENLNYNNKIGYYRVIKTKFDDYIVDFESDKYILFKIKENYDEAVSLLEMIEFSNKNVINNRKNINWAKIWSQKINYLDYKIECMTVNDNQFLNIFTYFIAFGEMAIQYYENIYNDVLIENPICVISHRRIFSPNFRMNFFNPIVLLCDYRVRDYSEYFKSEIFYRNVPIDILKKEFISLKNDILFSKLEIKMFISRFMFVSIFFDVVESIIDGCDKNDDIIMYEKKVKKFEEFLTFLFSSCM